MGNKDTVLQLVVVFSLLSFSVAERHETTAYSLLIQAHYPTANLPASTEMYLRGDLLGLSWDSGVVMESNGDDMWCITLLYTSSDVGKLLSFKALVKDQYYQIGANNMVILSTSSSSTIIDIFPWFFSGSGVYQYVRNVYSPQLNNTRDLVIYTPPSYFENTLKVMNNILVMHDGQNLFNASTSFAGIAWQCQQTIDEKVVEGEMEEVMIVGVNNSPDRTDELTYSFDSSVQAGGKGDLYLDFIEQTVLPLVSKQFRVNIDQPNLGILGSSLGGLISCYAGYTRSKVYSKAGCMSSSFWWNNEDFNNTILVKNSVPQSIEVYLDSGDAGIDNDDVIQTRTVKSHMETLGFKDNQTLYYYLDHGGQHSEYYWGTRFWVPMTELYPPLLIHL